MQVLLDGSVLVYQTSGSGQQCGATFTYPVADTSNEIEVATLTVKDMFETNNNYMNETNEIVVQKYHSTLFYTLVTNGNLIPSGVWTTIGVLKEEYKPEEEIWNFGTTANGANCVFMKIEKDGTVLVYQSSGSGQQCGVTFYYPVQA